MAVWLQASPFPSLGLSFPNQYNEEASRGFFKRREVQRYKTGKGEERSQLTEVCFILPEVPREESISGCCNRYRLVEVPIASGIIVLTKWTPLKKPWPFILSLPFPTSRPAHPSPTPESCVCYCLLTQEPVQLSEGPTIATTFSSLTICSGFL